MAEGNSIKLFRFNQKYCQAIGIKLPQMKQNRHKFNAVNWSFVICATEFAMTLLGFLAYDASSMAEYSANFYTLICIINAIFDYLILVWKLEDVLKYIDNCEKFIEESKSNCCEFLII